MKSSITIENLKELVRDRYIGRILFEIKNTPRTAMYLSKKQGIPIVQCYKRLNILMECGLLERRLLGIHKNGRKIWTYQSTVTIDVPFIENNRVKMSCSITQ